MKQRTEKQAAGPPEIGLGLDDLISLVILMR